MESKLTNLGKEYLPRNKQSNQGGHGWTNDRQTNARAEGWTGRQAETEGRKLNFLVLGCLEWSI